MRHPKFVIYSLIALCCIIAVVVFARSNKNTAQQSQVATDVKIPLNQLPPVFYIPDDARLECSMPFSDAEFTGLTFVTYKLDGAAPAEAFFDALASHLHPGGWMSLEYDMMRPQNEAVWTSLGYEKNNVMQRWCWHVKPSTGEVLSVRVMFFEDPPKGELPLSVTMVLYPQPEAKKLIAVYSKYHPLPAEVKNVVAP